MPEDFDIEDLLGIAIDAALEHPATQSAIERTVTAVEAAPGRLFAAFTQRRSTRRQRAPARRPQVVRVRVPVRDPLAQARAALQFSPDEPLTPKKIRDRRKVMANAFHPDKGGDPEIFAKMNAAATALLGSVGHG